LSRNIKDLQQRVGEMTDWRKQYEKRPFAFLGAAFGTGIALALLIPNGNGNGSRRGWSEPASEGRVVSGSVVTNRVLQAWDDIKGALMGVAVARFTDLLSEAIPGFDREYRKSEVKHSRTYAL
jgi:hypothetical protein